MRDSDMRSRHSGDIEDYAITMGVELSRTVAVQSWAPICEKY